MADELYGREPIPGVLVSGLAGMEPEPLTKDEYARLRTCLDLSRSDDNELRAIAEALDMCDEPKRRNLKTYLWSLCGKLGENRDDVDEMLTQGLAEPLLLYDPQIYDCEFNEAESLAAFLTVLRAGGWFARWLDLQIRWFADREHHEPPTPLLMMDILTLEAAAFQDKLDTARHILQNHWNALGFPGSKPPDPAEYNKKLYENPRRSLLGGKAVLQDDPRRHVLHDYRGCYSQRGG